MRSVPSGFPVEALAAPVGEFVAIEGGPVPVMKPPPQDARERREETPQRRTEPDAAYQAGACPTAKGEDGEEKGEGGSRQDERPGVT